MNYKDINSPIGVIYHSYKSKLSLSSAYFCDIEKNEETIERAAKKSEEFKSALQKIDPDLSFKYKIDSPESKLYDCYKAYLDSVKTLSESNDHLKQKIDKINTDREEIRKYILLIDPNFDDE